MIELTTGIIFLASSLYGSAASANAESKNISSTTPQVEASSTLLSAKQFTDPKVVQAYVRNEFADDPILVEVARCESTFRQYDSNGAVIRGKANRADVGVMQINEKYHAEKAIQLGYDIYSTQGNVAYAKYLYKESGTQPWSASGPCWSKAVTAVAMK